MSPITYPGGVTGGSGAGVSSPGQRVVFLGDSITIAQGNESNTAQWGLSYPTYATYASKGQLVRVRNAGVSGNTSAQMLARFATDVAAYKPSVVIVLAGTNDTNDSVATTFTEWTSTMQRIVAACRAIPAQPVLCTLPPNILSSARRARVTKFNAWIRRYCELNAIPCVDFYNLLADPATGDYLAAYGSVSNDKTHPLNAGYVAMGGLVASTLSGVLPPAAPLLPGENADPNNKITNGLFLTTTGSNSTLMPTGWSVQGGAHPTGVTGELVTGDATIKGNWWKITADGSASATDNEYQTVSSITPGHVYAHVGRFKATGMRGADTGSGSQFLIGAAFNSTLNQAGYDWRVASTHSYSCAEGAFYQEIVAPSDASTCLVRHQLLNTTAGAGTLQLAQIGLYDLTALGIV